MAKADPAPEAAGEGTRLFVKAPKGIAKMDDEASASSPTNPSTPSQPPSRLRHPRVRASRTEQRTRERMGLPRRIPAPPNDQRRGARRCSTRHPQRSTTRMGTGMIRRTPGGRTR